MSDVWLNFPWPVLPRRKTCHVKLLRKLRTSTQRINFDRLKVLFEGGIGSKASILIFPMIFLSHLGTNDSKLRHCRSKVIEESNERAFDWNWYSFDAQCSQDVKFLFEFGWK